MMTLSTKICRRLLLVAMLSAAGATRAEQVTPQRARSLAAKYVTVAPAKAPIVKKGVGLKPEATPYYIYEGQDGHSFAVVAGDDRLGGVMAYSREQRLDTTIENGIRLYLACLSAAYAALPADGSGVQTKAIIKPKATVGPLLATSWDQPYPYNKMVPTGAPYTGCVATAVAQIMKYHSWPAEGRGRVNYTFLFNRRERDKSELVTIDEDITGHRYEWDKMLNTYWGQYTNEEVDAVALLMRDVGYASHMQYNYDCSAAGLGDARNGLNNNFDYTAVLRVRNDEGPERFHQLVVREIETGFPVALSGTADRNDVGHAFVADGVDTDGYIHLNLGWGGSGNYWCVSFPPLNYSYNMEAVFAHPNRPGTYMPIDILPTSPKLHFNTGGQFYVDGMLDAPRAARPEAVTVKLNEFINRNNKPFMGDVGVALYNASGRLVGTYPTAYHDRGGYTTRMDNEWQTGQLVRDGLNVDPVDINLPLHNLGPGYYTLLPVAAQRLEGGGYSPWVPMQAAGRLVIELSDDSLRIAEQDGSRRGYQLSDHPHWSTDYVRRGGSATLVVPLRNLTGIPADGTLNVALTPVDGGNSVQSSVPFSNITTYYTTELSLSIYLSSSLPEGLYRFSAFVEHYGDTQQVKPYLNKDVSLLYVGPGVPARIDASGYATLYYGQTALALPREGGLTAHVVTAADAEGRMDWQSHGYGAGEVIPAGEAVLLKGEPGTYVLSVAQSTAQPTAGNLLHGSDEADSTRMETAQAGRYYALSMGMSGREAGFHYVRDEGAPFVIPAHSAFMAVPAATAAGRYLFDGSTPVGIDAAPRHHPATRTDAIYDLTGRRVTRPARGIYIVGGRKVLVK